MNTLPQSDTTASRSIRIPEDCWEALRKEAFESKTSITQVVADVVRRKYKLPVPSVSGEPPTNKRRTA